MIKHETEIAGVCVLEIDKREDERGFFARTWCKKELSKLGIAMEIAQISISFSPKKGTLRGMHYQRAPHAETKVVRCTRGAIFDVALDLREDSPTYRKWFGLELSMQNHRSLVIPKGCAHGLLTLTSDAEVLYLIDTPFVAEAAAGVRWNDPAFAIAWPFSPQVISERDASYPLVS